MANEVVISGFGDGIASEILSGEVTRLLAARGAGDILSHPALQYVPWSGASNVVKVSEFGLDAYDLMASTTDGTAVGNTAFTDSSTSITVGQYSKSYEFSDLALASSQLSDNMFVADAVITFNETLMNLVAALGSGFSQSVGSTGVNMTLQNFRDAIATLEAANAHGQKLAILHPTQWADLQASIGASTGVFEHRADLQGALADAGQYKGQVLGVDVFVTTHVPTANSDADRAGMMIAPGAVKWTDKVFRPSKDDLLYAGSLVVREDIDNKAATRSYVSHCFLGVAEGLDLAGVGIITDA